jgi:hypothetical protein
MGDRRMIAVQSELTSTTYISDHHDVFTHFFTEHINVCGWQRKLSQSVYEYSTLLAKHQVKLVREISPEEVFSEFNSLLPDSQYKHDFLEDVHLLSDMMCCIFDCKSVGLRLITLDHSMCPKFHTDKISGRLICTYMGKGTQWLPNAAKDDLELLNQIKTPNQMQGKHEVLSAKQGDVLLLKGDAWPKNEGKGAIHRSPPNPLIQRRVLLTLDPM